MNHKNVKRFTYEGIIADDSYIINTRDSYERIMSQEMQDSGYSPLLDLGTDWSTLYLPREDIYEFKLTGYGIYLGRKTCLQTYGIVHNRIVPRDTPSDKQQQ